VHSTGTIATSRILVNSGRTGLDELTLRRLNDASVAAAFV
jgi:hypothetical protein